MFNLKNVIDKIPLSTESKTTWMLRTVGIHQWPLLALTRPKVVELNSYRCRIKMPFSKLIKNHLNSVYFGALAIGADACVGALTYNLIAESGEPLSLVFKSFKADFLKRAEGDVIFICQQGEAAQALIDLAIKTSERQTTDIAAEAYVNNEKVADFVLALSVKKK